MGGIGSGARRTTKVGNVEDVPAVDIRALRRLGALTYGECVITPVLWAKHSLSASNGHLRLDLSEPEAGGTLTINALMAGSQLRQQVDLDLVLAPLGGHRCYFKCPITSRRCEVLYYLNGAFASREAQHLSYSVQSMGELSRAQRKARESSRPALKGRMGFLGCAGELESRRLI
jgi:hypothetical protein